MSNTEEPGNVRFGAGMCSQAVSCRLSHTEWTSQMERSQTNLICWNFCSYFVVFVIIVGLGLDFPCTCKPQAFDCNFHLALPVFIIFLFILWTDRKFQRVCRHLCSSVYAGRSWSHTSSFLASAFRHVVHAAFISLLYIVYVFLSGNWYVCCMNDHSKQQAQLPCKSEGSLTDEERVIIAELRNKSWVRVPFRSTCV